MFFVFDVYDKFFKKDKFSISTFTFNFEECFFVKEKFSCGKEFDQR